MLWLSDKFKWQDKAVQDGQVDGHVPRQTSSTWALDTGDEVLKERVLISLEVKGQISLQGLKDCGGVRQGQTLPQYPWVGLTDLEEVGRNDENK